MIGGILSFLAGLLRGALAIFSRKNEPDMVANKVAIDDAKRADEIAALECRAAAGDAAALAELRNRLSE